VDPFDPPGAPNQLRVVLSVYVVSLYRCVQGNLVLYSVFLFSELYRANLFLFFCGINKPTSWLANRVQIETKRIIFLLCIYILYFSLISILGGRGVVPRRRGDSAKMGEPNLVPHRSCRPRQSRVCLIHSTPTAEVLRILVQMQLEILSTKSVHHIWRRGLHNSK